MTVSGVQLSALANGTLFTNVQIEARGQLVNALVPAVGVLVRVYTHVPGYVAGNSQGGTAVTVYQDEALTTPLQQPVSTNPDGTVPGFVAGGQSLDLVCTGGPFTTEQVFVVNTTQGSSGGGTLGGDATGAAASNIVNTVKNGKTPLTADQNLADVADALTARGNLGLGSAAQAASSAFDPAGAAAAVLGEPLGLTGAVTPTRFVGATTNGAPTTGTFLQGDFVVVVANPPAIEVCVTAGTPGTWAPLTGSGGGGVTVQGSIGTNIGATATIDFASLAATKMLVGNVNTGLVVTVLNPDASGGSLGILELFNTSGQTQILVSDGTVSSPVTIAPSGLTRIEVRCPDATDIDPVVVGGSGMPNPMTTAGDVIVAGASGVPTRFAKGADGTVLGYSAGALAAVTALLAANNGSDVVDTAAFRANLKNQVLGHARAAATTNVASLSGTTTIDGVALAAGDPVLLTGQTTGLQNGPWLVQTGAWTRPSDYATGLQFTSRLVPVTGGTTTANHGIWQLQSNAVITVGTTATAWANLSSTGSSWTRTQTDPLYAPQWPNLVGAPGVMHPVAASTTVGLGTLTPSGVRVIVPKAGTLHDVSWCVTTSAGNVAAAIYDTGDASAGNRSLLASSGSLAVGAAGWQSWDPSLAVSAGQELEFMVMTDSPGSAAAFAGCTLTTVASASFPSGFVPVAGGASPKLVIKFAAVGSLTAWPATVAEGSIASPGTKFPFLIARVS